MPILVRGIAQKSLKELFGWIDAHDLALPELQRPSVWGDSKIPRLLSSIYNDYPFGILLVWTPKPEERIKCRPFAVQDGAAYDREHQSAHYLVDGQQRLTSLYKALHNREEPEVQVLFNIKDERFELANKRLSKKDGWYPVGHLLTKNTRERNSFMDEHRALGDPYIESLFKKLDRLQPENVQMSLYNVEEKPYCEVAEIFERINLGTPVKKSQIALGKLSTIAPGVVQQVEDYLQRMRPKHGNEFDLDLFMMTLAVTTTEHADLDALADRYGIGDAKGPASKANMARKVLSQDLNRAFVALDAAFAFSDEYLHIDTMKYFPSERTLMGLAFLQSKRPGLLKAPVIANKTAFWAASALLCKRHGDMRELNADIRQIRDEGTDESVVDALLSNNTAGDPFHQIQKLLDFESPIDRNNRLFGFVYALERWKGGVSWITTGFQIRTTGNKEEALHEHHVYPKAQVEREKNPEGKAWKEEWISDIANLTFLLDKDNIKLADPDISYLKRYLPYLGPHMVDDRKDQDYGDSDYLRFLKDRRTRIHAELLKFVRSLKDGAGA